MKIKIRILIAAFAVIFTQFAFEAAAQVPLNPLPSRAVGHAKLQVVTLNPNLVEGRELDSPQAVAVDTANGETILYVADTRNNRVLAWRNAKSAAAGAFADAVLGQQDLFSTLALGPGTSFTSGLSSPTSVAVDSRGNVYVADAGNNRILRYPQPFMQPDSVKLSDLVIGQTGTGTNAPNAGGISERTLALNAGSGAYRCGMVFDGQGNLWVSDAANNRVLRYPSSALGDGASNAPAATVVLGQPDFRTNIPANSRASKTALTSPSGIALDSAGRLFVADYQLRVAVYAPPFTTAMSASRLMGLVPTPAQGQPAPLPINEYSMGVVLNGQAIPAEGVFTVGNIPFVVDTPAHRILRFDPFDQWPAETAQQFSPAARATIGQDTSQQSIFKTNRGLAEPSNTSFASPVGATFAAGQTWIADAGNNRILAMGDISSGPPLSAGAPYNGVQVFGQIDFPFNSANLIEGREFNFGNQSAGVVIDSTSNPPRLYVSDSFNNRILGFKDARTVRTGDTADIVIGQPDFNRSLVNFPANDGTIRNNSGLFAPAGIAVDSSGNLFVADSGNGRVLRFPSPFNQTQRPMQADLVLGQSSFTARQTDATARTLGVPYGLAFSVNGILFVSDNAHNRVAMFVPPFSTGMAAARIFGQPDFSSSAPGSYNPATGVDNRFLNPRHISTDTDDRLYVCDTGNNRVAIFERAPLAGADPHPGFSLTNSIQTPVSIYVSPVTGEIWIGNGGRNEARRYQNYDKLILGGDSASYIISNVPAPLALTLDAFSNLYSADNVNRVAIHYPLVSAVNAGNLLPRIAPGMYASMFSPDNIFTSQPGTGFSTVPMPTTLNDVQVLLDGKLSPVQYVGPGQVNFLVPNGAATSGQSEINVVQASTGRVIGAGFTQNFTASPGFLTFATTGSPQQVAALNQDGTINGSGLVGTLALSAAARGSVISMFATGAGFIPGAPADGQPASGQTPSAGTLRVAVNNVFLQDSDVLYSGLAPGLIGVWQLNVRIPTTVPPSNTIPVLILKDGVPSNNPNNVNQIRTTIAVK